MTDIDFQGFFLCEIYLFIYVTTQYQLFLSFQYLLMQVLPPLYHPHLKREGEGPSGCHPPMLTISHSHIEVTAVLGLHSLVGDSVSENPQWSRLVDYVGLPVETLSASGPSILLSTLL